MITFLDHRDQCLSVFPYLPPVCVQGVPYLIVWCIITELKKPFTTGQMCFSNAIRAYIEPYTRSFLPKIADIQDNSARDRHSRVAKNNLNKDAILQRRLLYITCIMRRLLLLHVNIIMPLSEQLLSMPVRTSLTTKNPLPMIPVE